MLRSACPEVEKSQTSKVGVHADQPLSSGSMELVFLGTRGEIEKRTRRHQRHSALLVRCRRARIMVDCGADWRRRLARLAPSAIVLTHGHPDHAFGLAGGAPCPVYATRETWSLIDRYPVTSRRFVTVGKPFSIEGVRFEPFAVQHSRRAPAVGYRVTVELHIDLLCAGRDCHPASSTGTARCPALYRRRREPRATDRAAKKRQAHRPYDDARTA